MKPTNSFVRPMLTDLYQLTMAYAYWKSGKYNDRAVFDLFFRKNPFGGELTIFAGLEEVIRFVSSFKFKKEDLEYLMNGPMKGCDPDFFAWLSKVDCSGLKIYAVPEGTLVFPKTPLIRVEGPLAIAQLMETAFLNLVNYSSLIATNASRFRLAAGEDKKLIEFGLRRAQGPDGGISASRYSYMGGFDGTSNVLAGQLFGMPVKGTHAHAFVSSFSDISDLKETHLIGKDGIRHNFVELVLEYRRQLNFNRTNEGELAAFIAYAQAFPNDFLALVDTYNTLASGVPNFCCVALALLAIGYKPIGVRLDSGDLAYLSKETRKIFTVVAEKLSLESPSFSRLTIFASNDIDETVLLSLAQQGHEIDGFGIGTHLVTCKAQPALGCVYKLVEINGQPRIKLSDESDKMTVPGRKETYRLIGKDGQPLLDVMVKVGRDIPQPGKKILCRHPFQEDKRAYVIPEEVVALHQCVWDGKRIYRFPTLDAIRTYVTEQIKSMRPDHLRFTNPTPYKISVDEELYTTIHKIWMQEAPIAEIS